MKKILIFVVATAMVLTVTGCNAAPASVAPASSAPAQSAPAPSAPAASAPAASAPASTAAWSIVIEGTEKSPVEFTQAMAESIGIIKQSAAVKDKDSTLPAQEWEGVLLEKVLASLGASAYTTVKVESADNTGREYTPDVVAASKALLGFKADGKALDAQSGPVMLVVDGKGPNWQIKKVTKITVIK